MALAQRILVSLFVFGIIGLFTFLGLVTPGGTGWFLYFFLIPFWSLFPLVILGGQAALIIVGAYAVLYPLVRILIGRTFWYVRAQDDLKSKGMAQIGGVTFRAGASGGGLSGGGGRSGGGGASGSW
jgi:uncharacterized protein